MAPVSHIMTPLSTSRNSPSVTIRNGNVNTIRIGLTMVFTDAKDHRDNEEKDDLAVEGDAVNESGGEPEGKGVDEEADEEIHGRIQNAKCKMQTVHDRRWYAAG